MTDFPDRDEWTDKPDAKGECDNCGEMDFLTVAYVTGIESYVCRDCMGMRHDEICEDVKQKTQAEEAMEAAEWDELGATDLIEPDELVNLTTRPTDLSNNDFSDV